MSLKIKQLKPLAETLNDELGLTGKSKLKTVAVKATVLEQAIIEKCEELGEDLFDIEFSEELIETKVSSAAITGKPSSSAN